jgi:hypothetical protein
VPESVDVLRREGRYDLQRHINANVREEQTLGAPRRTANTAR